MTKSSLLIALVSVMFFNLVNGQTKSTKTSAADFQKSVKQLANLFKKKKTDSTGTNTEGQKADKTGDNNVGNATHKASAGSTKAGTSIPDVKLLDVDQIQPFNSGVAVVIKGSSYALINAKGETVIPFNTYGALSTNMANAQYAFFTNGLIRYRTMDQQQWGYMNPEGKIIAKGVLSDLTENKRYLRLNNSDHSTTYTTPEGKTYTHPASVDDIVDGIGIVRKTVDNGNRNIYGYKKLTGETLTAVIFDEAYPFSDGMAMVGKKNEFGEMKYGFINRLGQQAIPFSFSVKPSNFTSGFARVEPKDKAEFEYAFINKSGQIKLKQTRSDITQFGSFERFTNYGFAYSAKYIMDTTFKMTSKKSFFASYGIPEDSWFVQEPNYMEGETNAKLFFSTRGVNSSSTTYPLVGFINLGTKKVVMPTFDLLNQSFIYFDPVSHLALAKAPLGRDNKNIPVFREGYINEDGLFVMIKGKGSQW